MTFSLLELSFNRRACEVLDRPETQRSQMDLGQQHCAGNEVIRKKQKTLQYNMIVLGYYILFSLVGSYWAEDESQGDCGILSGGDPPEKSWIKAPCLAHTYYICQLQMWPSLSFWAEPEHTNLPLTSFTSSITFQIMTLSTIHFCQ